MTHRGVRDHKLRKETKEAYDKEQRRQSNLEAENPASNDFLTPSTQSLEKNGHSLKEAEAGIERGLGKIYDTSTGTQQEGLTEKCRLKEF